MLPHPSWCYRGTAGGTVKPLLPFSPASSEASQSPQASGLPTVSSIDAALPECVQHCVPRHKLLENLSACGWPSLDLGSLFCELGGWNPHLGCYVPSVWISLSIPFLCICPALRTKPAALQS